MLQFLAFIFIAILRMALVLNSPASLWILLCGIITFIQNLHIKSYASKAPHRIEFMVMHGPTAFEFGCEYGFFLLLSLMLLTFKTMLEIAWIPTSGLVWWYRFYSSLLRDPGGRSLRQIFRDPDPIAIFTDKRDSIAEIIRPREDTVPIAQPISAAPDISSHPYRRPRKRRKSAGHRRKRPPSRPSSASYFPSALPPPPSQVLGYLLHHLWSDHQHAMIFNELNLIILSFWIMFGVRAFKLCGAVFTSCKNKLRHYLGYSESRSASHIPEK